MQAMASPTTSWSGTARGYNPKPIRMAPLVLPESSAAVARQAVWSSAFSVESTDARGIRAEQCTRRASTDVFNRPCICNLPIGDRQPLPQGGAAAAAAPEPSEPIPAAPPEPPGAPEAPSAPARAPSDTGSPGPPALPGPPAGESLRRMSAAEPLATAAQPPRQAGAAAAAVAAQGPVAALAESKIVGQLLQLARDMRRPRAYIGYSCFSLLRPCAGAPPVRTGGGGPRRSNT